MASPENDDDDVCIIEPPPSAKRAKAADPDAATAALIARLVSEDLDIPPRPPPSSGRGDDSGGPSGATGDNGDNGATCPMFRLLRTQARAVNLSPRPLHTTAFPHNNKTFPRIRAPLLPGPFGTAWTAPDPLKVPFSLSAESLHPLLQLVPGRCPPHAARVAYAVNEREERVRCERCTTITTPSPVVFSDLGTPLALAPHLSPVPPRLTHIALPAPRPPAAPLPPPGHSRARQLRFRHPLQHLSGRPRRCCSLRHPNAFSPWFLA